MTPAEFIAKWKEDKLSDQAGAQAHFHDLCEMLGVEKPNCPDNYSFERGAKRTQSPHQPDMRSIAGCDTRSRQEPTMVDAANPGYST